MSFLGWGQCFSFMKITPSIHEKVKKKNVPYVPMMDRCDLVQLIGSRRETTNTNTDTHHQQVRCVSLSGVSMFVKKCNIMMNGMTRRSITDGFFHKTTDFPC